MDILQTDSIESLILAFDKSETLEDELTGLQSLWTVIEEYVSSAKLMSVGVSDVDTDLFIKLFNWSKVYSVAKKLTKKVPQLSWLCNNVQHCILNFKLQY